VYASAGCGFTGGPCRILTDQKEDKSDKHFFDVEKFRKIHSETSKRAGRLKRIQNRVEWAFGSASGLLTSVGLPMMFVVLLISIPLVIYYWGGLAMYALIASFFIIVAVVGEKKFGASMQFKESHFLRKTLAQLIAYSFVLGIFLLLFFKYAGK